MRRLIGLLFIALTLNVSSQTIYRGGVLKPERSYGYGADTMYRQLVSMPAGDAAAGYVIALGADSAFWKIDTDTINLSGTLNLKTDFVNCYLCDTIHTDVINWNGTIIDITDTSFWKLGAGSNSLMDKRSTTGSGANGLTAGFQAVNSGSSGLAIGSAANNSGSSGLAIGLNSSNTAVNGSAIGYTSSNTATEGQAIGINATNRIENSTNISGAIVIRKSDGNSNSYPYAYMAGAEVVISTPTVDMEATGTTTIAFPTGVKMFVNEVGFIATSANTVGGQPTISYGITGNNDALLAATATTGIASAGDRDRQTTLLISSGVTSLTAEITIAATATTLVGRYYFKGFIIEDQ